MKTMIKKMKTAGLGLAVVCAFICLTSEKLNMAANFSGQWTLNTTKSELGQYGARMAATKMTVVADANGMSVEKTTNGQNGETKVTDKITFDGKENSNAFFGTNTRQSTSKWSDDGKTQTTTWKASMENNGQKFDLSGSETWSLSADGATLTLTNSTSFGGQANTTKQVYDKAK